MNASYETLKENGEYISSNMKKHLISKAWKQMPNEIRQKWRLLRDMDKRRFVHVTCLKDLPGNKDAKLDASMGLSMHELAGLAAFDSSDDGD